MIDAQTYVEHVQIAGDRVAQAAEGKLSTEVPSCPGFTLERLIAHTGEFARWVAVMVETGQPAPPSEPKVEGDVLETHRTEIAHLVEALRAKDPDAQTWTWSTGADRARFWFRRAAQELTMHRWDVENAVGDPLPIDPTLAADGVDEMLTVFGAPNVVGFDTIAKVFDAHAPVGLEATDTGDIWTFIRDGDVFDFSASDPAVTAKGTASDLLLFIWGRKGTDVLDVSGDDTLLTRWQERVKI